MRGKLEIGWERVKMFEDRWKCSELISWLSGSCMILCFTCYLLQQGPSSTELFGGREPSGESGRLWPSASDEG